MFNSIEKQLRKLSSASKGSGVKGSAKKTGTKVLRSASRTFIGPMPAPTASPAAAAAPMASAIPPVARSLFPSSPSAGSSPSRGATSPATPTSRTMMLEMLQTITESSAVVGNPVELKQWDCTKNDHRWFKDMLTRWAANGSNKEITIEKRNALITETTVSTIELHMMAKLETVDRNMWRQVDNQLFFKLMSFLFKEGKRDASMAEQIPGRVVQLFLNMKEGYTSFVKPLRELHKLKEECADNVKDCTPEAVKQQIEALFKLFPKDATHGRLQERMNRHGKPRTLEEFETVLIRESNEMHASHLEVITCGYQVLPASGKPGDKTNLNQPKFKSNNKRKFDSITTTNNQQTDKVSKFHNGCGHVHPEKECALIKHPDYNFTNLPWNQSEKGLAWKEQGWYHLPYNKTLDPTIKWEPPPLPEKKPRFNKSGNKSWKKDITGEEPSLYHSAFMHKCQCIKTPVVPYVEHHIFSLASAISSIVNVTDTNDQSITVPFFVCSKGIKVEVNALIDTGALHSNYISERLAEMLQANGNAGCKCSTNICSPVNETCLINNNNLKFSFQLLHEKANINTPITAVILPSNYDLIIGRETLKQLRLIEKFASHFLPDDVKDLSNKKVSKRLYSMLASDRKSCHLPATGVYLNVNNWISSTLCLLENTTMNKTVKRELFLDSIPGDDDEIAQYHKDAPWDIDINKSEPVPEPRIEGSDSLKHAIRTLCEEFNYLFTMEVRNEPAKVDSFTLTVDDDEWETRRNMSAPRPQSIQNQAEIDRQVKKLLDLGVIEYSQEAYNSQVLLADKPNGKKRFCIDFRNLNKASKSFGWPLPNINHMLET